ncbi:hypothetical protein [Hyphococcus sp.]|uniref:hypothetical protein n=1 Tax=Hyphococcus sp. TaxID=2038636 RepID=UPI003CCC0371
MKLKIKLYLLLMAGAFSAPAYGGELAGACVEALEADGRDAAGCACLEEEAIANDLVDEFLALGEIEDPAERYASASPEAQAAMDKCTR